MKDCVILEGKKKCLDGVREYFFAHHQLSSILQTLKTLIFFFSSIRGNCSKSGRRESFEAGAALQPLLIPLTRLSCD